MENLAGELNRWDLLSYPGLAVAVVGIVAALKRLFHKYVKGNETLLAFILTFVVGIVSKLTVPNAFSNVPWIVFLVSLVFVAKETGSIHDRLVNPILHNKPAPNPPGKAPASQGGK